MRVLVTGHQGYLGSILTPMLLADGHRVTGLDSGLFARCSFPQVTAPAAVANVAKITADIRSITPGDIAGHDAVIHLAGLSNDPLGALDPKLTMQINHRASVRLARLARDAGVRRMVLASTCSVYGASDGSVLTETAPLAPVTPYAESKLRMEEDISRLASDDFEPVFLRAGTVYGLSPLIRFDLVVNNLVAWATSTGEIRLKSDGSAWRPIIHIEDVARTFAAVLTQPAGKVSNRAFNIASAGCNLKVAEIADRIARCLPDCAVVFEPNASGDTRSYRVSGDRLAQLLGDDWFNRSLETDIREMAAIFRQARLEPEDFEGPRYQRLAHLKSLMEASIINGELFLN